MLLYRPVGLEEMRLIFAAGMDAFPPRLPEQPIFYPVITEAYAAQIARDWNTKSGSHAGYVTRFVLNDAHAASLPMKTVGSREHQELWVPAEELSRFNAEIDGRIEVVNAFFGDGFKGLVPERFMLKGKDAVAQLVALSGTYSYSLMDFHGEVAANRGAIFLHFPFWKHRGFAEQGLSAPRHQELMNAIRKVWSDVSPEIPLPDF